jgi:hypothetical protein
VLRQVLRRKRALCQAIEHAQRSLRQASGKHVGNSMFTVSRSARVRM